MTIGVTAADDHTVGDAGFAAHIESDDVTTFEVINFVGDEIVKCLALQGVTSVPVRASELGQMGADYNTPNP